MYNKALEYLKYPGLEMIFIFLEDMIWLWKEMTEAQMKETSGIQSLVGSGFCRVF